ncbi:hypothetical protein A4157S1_800179 [Escherichia coli]|nr:hypothetical protein A4157S1_800179 [Escherichia coli]
MADTGQLAAHAPHPLQSWLLSCGW